MPGRFDGKVALIIGGSSSIGLATARDLLAEGARVTIAARDAARLATAGEELRRTHPERVDELTGDMALLGEAERLVAATVFRFGHLNILVTSAATDHTRPIVEADEEEIAAVLRTNALARCSPRAPPPAPSAPKEGASSRSATAARRGRPNRSVYAASKGAVEAWTRVLAVELAPRGITVNCVAPGLTATPMLGDHADDPARLRQIPMGRIGQPEDVAAAVLLLASPEAASVTGQTVDATGGYGL